MALMSSSPLRIDMPSADAVILPAETIFFTGKVPSDLAWTGLSTSSIFPVQRRFSYVNDHARRNSP
jgi:hypothetical protein